MSNISEPSIFHDGELSICSDYREWMHLGDCGMQAPDFNCCIVDIMEKYNLRDQFAWGYVPKCELDE